jgi:hypothetical protein
MAHDGEPLVHWNAAYVCLQQERNNNSLKSSHLNALKGTAYFKKKEVSYLLWNSYHFSLVFPKPLNEIIVKLYESTYHASTEETVLCNCASLITKLSSLLDKHPYAPGCHLLLNSMSFLTTSAHSKHFIMLAKANIIHFYYWFWAKNLLAPHENAFSSKSL